jgi:urease accessory protein
MYVDTSSSEGTGALRLQRAEGLARVSFRRKTGATRLCTLYQGGCAKVRLPRPVDDLPPEAILINTAGGLTGGDRLTIEVEVGRNASAVVTTQACERIYKSLGADALITNRISLAAGARLAWLPQETIPFDGARLARSLEVELEEDATLLAVEAILFGRAAMGEVLRSGKVHDRWRVRRGTRLIHADDFRIEGDIAAQLRKPAVLAGNRATATVLLVAPETEVHLEGARAIIGEAGGATAFGGKLLCRLVAETGLSLRRRLEPLLTRLNGGMPLPRVWQS